MSEQLDNELRKRISEVFDNYEDTAPAEEGWLLLREKFPEKKKNRIIPMWWMSAAALILLLATFGLWFYNKPQKAEQVAVKPVIKTKQSNQEQNIVGSNNTSTSPSVTRSNQSTVANTSAQTTTGSQPSSTEQFAVGSKVSKDRSTYSHKPLTPGANTPVFNNLRVTNVIAPGASAYVTNNAGKPNINSTSVAVNVDSSTNTLQQNVLAQQTPVKTQQAKSIIAVKKDSASADNAQSRMATLLAKDQAKEDQNLQKNKKDNTSTNKRVLYGIYAATYFNYAEGSKTQMNTGAGFSTDIRLSKNFKLSTGIAIGKNTLSYDNQPVTASIQGDAYSASNYARVEVLPAAVSNQLGFTPLKVAASPTVSGYNVSLTGLDVPVNIKYEFNPQKTDAYISAGLSSGTFIRENFSYRFDSNVRDAISTSAVSIPDASSSKSFTGFNFARTLNLSMGVGYQLTRQNRLVIEPFFKYPLGGLGSQQIRFGSGGINLQFKFQGGK